MFVEYRYAILNYPCAVEELDALCRDADVFELGSGKWGGFAQQVLKARARSYLGVDLCAPITHPRDARFVKEDARAVLERLPDDSSVSISSGFFDERVVRDLDSIIAQTARVAPEGLHWLAPDDPTLSRRFALAGLALDEIAPSVYRTRRIGTQRI